MSRGDREQRRIYIQIPLEPTCPPALAPGPPTLKICHENAGGCNGSKAWWYNNFSPTAYNTLFNPSSSQAREFIPNQLPTRSVPLLSDRHIDYTPLEQLLAQQDFQAADRITLQKMCELAGPDAVQRKWLYFTEVENFPIADLQTINTLWLLHSQGKFGFSVQREIWLSTGKNWDKFWLKIGWKTGNTWTRYPNEFTWDLSAPRGHIPLSNQLRGVRVIAALLNHPAWSSTPSGG